LAIVSIVLILIFIVLFAIGLGPIPYVYSNEVFAVEARAAGLSLAMFIVRGIIIKIFNEIVYFIELVLQFFGGIILLTTSITYRRLCVSYFLFIYGIGIRLTFHQSKIYCCLVLFLLS
jgi:hypothetical protein